MFQVIFCYFKLNCHAFKKRKKTPLKHQVMYLGAAEVMSLSPQGSVNAECMMYCHSKKCMRSLARECRLLSYQQVIH